MIRSLLSTLVIVALVAAPSFAFSTEEEARVLRQAEQTVLDAIHSRSQMPRVSGSAVVDEDHIQVDLFQVNENEAIIPQSSERFIVELSTHTITSIGAPVGEVAVLPARNVVAKAKNDAIARFAQVHPASGSEVADGTAPRVHGTTTNAQGQIVVTCESFGGIAGMWMGDSISYTYSADGMFVAASQN